MGKNILVVDDNIEFLLSLKGALEKYDNSFSVVIAGDGRAAIEELKREAILMAITDLKMPGEMDGFALMAQITDLYAHIPVIVMDSSGAPETERRAREGGAAGYIKKPFKISDLIRQIEATLKKQSEGGTLRDVSPSVFLQLIEMEEKTCTIRLVNNSSDKQGVLFFNEGELIDAMVDDLRGEDAAYQIFAWQKVTLSIQNSCPLKEKKVHRELQAILLDAMRLRDEGGLPQKPIDEAALHKKPVKPPKKIQIRKLGSIDAVRSKLEQEIGEKCGLDDICQDNSCDGMIEQMEQLGSLFNVGGLLLSYINKDESNDFVLLPGEETTIISLNPRCPRDRIVEVLTV